MSNSYGILSIPSSVYENNFTDLKKTKDKIEIKLPSHVMSRIPNMTIKWIIHKLTFQMLILFFLLKLAPVYILYI